MKLILLLLCVSITAQSSELKSTWEQLVDTFKTGNKEAAIKLAVGSKVKTFERWKWDLVKSRASQWQFEYVSEFIVKGGKAGYVVSKTNGRLGTDIFSLIDGKWKVSDSIGNKSIKSQKDVDDWKRETVVYSTVISPLKKIGIKTATYFADGEAFIIPHYKKMKITDEDLLIESPESGQKVQVLMCEGYTYMGSSDKVIGLLGKPVWGKYYAVWGDGYAAEISKENFLKASKELKMSKAKGRLKRSKIPSGLY